MNHPCRCEKCYAARDDELARARKADHAEIERLRKIELAGHALWNAHCKSHDAIPSTRYTPPKKWGMNYGELVALAEALGIVPRPLA